MWRSLVIAAACSAPEPVATRQGPAEAPARTPIDAELAIADAGAFTLPIAWTTCDADADCTIVALGCCDETPVNRAHAVKLRAVLERSGRPFCPPKSPCGPSKVGTWDGEPGSCRGGACRKPGGL